MQLSGTATPFGGEDDEAEEDDYGVSSVAMVAAEEGGRVAVTVDLRSEVRRGEAVRVGEEWFRVSTLEDRCVGVWGCWRVGVLHGVGRTDRGIRT